MMIRIWKLNVVFVLVTVLLLSGCTEAEQTVPFDPGAFETSRPDQAVVITVPKGRFVQSEPVPYTITNRSTSTVYYPANGPSCDWPAAGVDTFLYVGTTESGWKRVPVHALNVKVTKEEPAIVELAAGETVECFWDQTARQDPELEGEERFRRRSEIASVPPGYYQFNFDYSFDHDDPYGERSYSDILEIE